MAAPTDRPITTPRLADILLRLGESYAIRQKRRDRYEKRPRIDEFVVARFAAAWRRGEQHGLFEATPPETVGAMCAMIGRLRFDEECWGPHNIRSIEARRRIEKDLIPAAIHPAERERFLAMRFPEADEWLRERAAAYDQEDKRIWAGGEDHPYLEVVDWVARRTGLPGKVICKAVRKRFSGFPEVVDRLRGIDERGETAELWQMIQKLGGEDGTPPVVAPIIAALSKGAPDPPRVTDKSEGDGTRTVDTPPPSPPALATTPPGTDNSEGDGDKGDDANATPDKDRHDKLGRMARAYRTAYLSYCYAMARCRDFQNRQAEGQRVFDWEVYDWLQENEFDERDFDLKDEHQRELANYKLPLLDTWKTYVRKGRAVFNEQKNVRRDDPLAKGNVKRRNEI
ncbi:MAG: hypothetical protein KJ000_34335 [Pirellulaceae bacterium]|nr:hypothetical protein [Pirellulaceae bacterium]